MNTPVDGIVNIYKPKGMTSHQVVQAVRRLLGQRRVGHTGTLDPLASGVLPLVMGKATRVAEFMSLKDKVYWAEVVFGRTTTTYDAEGETVTEQPNPSLTLDEVAEAIREFRGKIEQSPPAYSAVKQRGIPAYKFARAGIEVTPRKRLVRIDAINILDWQPGDPPRVHLQIKCGSGTYIRSLAHDLGQKLGCGAFLSGLVRTKVGPFNLRNALRLEALELAVELGYWNELVYPLDEALTDLDVIVLSDNSLEIIRQGGNLYKILSNKYNLFRAYTDSGDLIGILQYRKKEGLLHPKKVFY